LEKCKARDMYKTLLGSTVHNSKNPETTQMLIKRNWRDLWYCYIMEYSKGSEFNEVQQDTAHRYLNLCFIILWGGGNMGLKVQMKEPEHVWH